MRGKDKMRLKNYLENIKELNETQTISNEEYRAYIKELMGDDEE